MSYHEVFRGCLISYHGSRYSVAHRCAGKRAVVKEPVEGGHIVI